MVTRANATNNKEERENQTLHAYCKAQDDIMMIRDPKYIKPEMSRNE